MDETDDEAADRETLTATNLAVAEWEQRRDPGSIQRLFEVLSPHLIFRRSDGSVVSKEKFIESLTHPGPFTTRESSDVSVQLAGARAVVILTVTVTLPDKTKQRFRNIRVWFRHQGSWLLEVWFNDNVTTLSDVDPEVVPPR